MASQYPRYSNLYASFGETTAAVVNVGSGALKVLNVFNTNAADRFIMVFDRATIPPTGTRPLLCYPVYAKNGYTELNEEQFTNEGQVFDNGLAWAMSTTPGTYNPAAATDAVIQIRWI